MEQKNYKLELVNELIKNSEYIRGLAKKLNTNHMNVLRKLNELFEENVVDYTKEGKNKVYFLKKTAETRAYIFMSENYKLIKILEKYNYLRKIIEKIQKNKKIRLAIIFGSYAKGTTKKDSDIDIYVETTNRKIKQELEAIDSKLSIKIGRYKKTNILIKEIEKNHVIIKGVENYYEKNRFFD